MHLLIVILMKEDGKGSIKNLTKGGKKRKEEGTILLNRTVHLILTLKFQRLIVTQILSHLQVMLVVQVMRGIEEGKNIQGVTSTSVQKGKEKRNERKDEEDTPKDQDTSQEGNLCFLKFILTCFQFCLFIILFKLVTNLVNDFLPLMLLYFFSARLLVQIPFHCKLFE